MKTSTQVIVILLLIAGAAAIMIFNKNNAPVPATAEPIQKERQQKQEPDVRHTTSDIDELTLESVVVPYVKKHGRLPVYYITKNEARKQGWVASEGNLCEVLPGRAIGGDVFTNRQKLLPVKKAGDGTKQTLIIIAAEEMLTVFYSPTMERYM